MRPVSWPETLIFWLVIVWAFAPEFGIVRRARQHVSASDSRDAGSLQVILIGMWIAMLAAFPVAMIPALRFPPWAARASLWIGVLTVIAGSLLRRHCWRMLGESFTGDVVARTDQSVIERGAYGWVRHPSYTGGILMNTGIGIALGSWGSALLLAVASIAVYAYRIAVEERALLETIGEPYRVYMQRRKRLIPFLY